MLVKLFSGTLMIDRYKYNEVVRVPTSRTFIGVPSVGTPIRVSSVGTPV